MRNPACGNWTEEETNWSDKDTEFIKQAMKGENIPTSYEELLDEYESSLLDIPI